MRKLLVLVATVSALLVVAVAAPVAHVAILLAFLLPIWWGAFVALAGLGASLALLLTGWVGGELGRWLPFILPF